MALHPAASPIYPSFPRKRESTVRYASGKRGDAGQLDATQKFQGRAAAGGDVGHAAHQPQGLHGLGGGAAADYARNVRARRRWPWATTRVPSLNRGISKTPIGPFQMTVRHCCNSRANSARAMGPMSIM